MQRLQQQLAAMEGRSYRAYKDLRGPYRFPRFELLFDHVQGDPFAAPSRVSVTVNGETAGFPPSLWQDRRRRTASEDYLARTLAACIRRLGPGPGGSGHSGEIAVARLGQQVLARNAVRLDEDGVEARLTVGLPAHGRRIDARGATELLLERLPALVEACLLLPNLDAHAMAAHADCVEDQGALRDWLETAGLVAFVADGAHLPRRSGVDDRPLEQEVVTFRAPPSLRREVELPHAGKVSGLGVPPGVTLIVGGGFHGKSTLLRALERGVYDHLPGDGRERVVTRADAVKVRAEDGRAVSRLDISPFIDHLPRGRDTHTFDTENASGSTSQAANIVEALAGGCKLLLVDEDTSATNFMIRDRRMQALVAPEQEPITPLLHRVRELYDEHGVSSVIVMGGSGDYFEVADTVIMLDAFEPYDVSERARALAGDDLARQPHRALPPLFAGAPRRPTAEALSAARGQREERIDARAVQRLQYGARELDLSAVEQLVDRGQTEAIGWMLLYYARHLRTGERDLIPALRELLARVEAEGLDLVAPWRLGTFALPRLQELAAAINRLRDAQWE